MAPLGFGLRLDDFDIEYYSGSMLTVEFAGGAEPRRIPVEVGKVVPLRDGLSVEVLRAFLDFKITSDGPADASKEPLNPAVQVRLRRPAGETTQWVFAKFPGFHAHDSGASDVTLRYEYQDPTPKTFISRVTVLNPAGQPARQATILVNQPLRVHGYTFYQSSYQGKTISVFEVVSDPGTPLVITGFVLMPLGMVFVFYVNPFILKKRSKGDV
jgi:hypothetical protein